MEHHRFGQKSLDELKGVHPALVSVATLALKYSHQDFAVHDGLRTPAEQNALFRRGASQIDGYSKIGKHQVQPATGYGHAVDLVPYVPGRGLVWDWDLIYPICRAMTAASRKLNVPIRWGGCWGHEAIHTMSGDPENWVQAYVKRKRDQGRRAFNDGPHYELLGM